MLTSKIITSKDDRKINNKIITRKINNKIINKIFSVN